MSETEPWITAVLYFQDNELEAVQDLEEQPEPGLGGKAGERGVLETKLRKCFRQVNPILFHW